MHYMDDFIGDIRNSEKLFWVLLMDAGILRFR